MTDRIEVIIPTFNEAATIAPLIERLRRACPGALVTVVDNGSTDGTMGIVEALEDVRLIRHARNLGYGASLRDGLAQSRGERIAMIDADLEYLPEDLPVVIDRLGSSPAVYGSRLLSNASTRRTMPLVRAAGNAFVTALFNLLFDQALTDLYTGVRAVHRSVLPEPLPQSDGFEFVLELSVRLSQAGVRIAEVPIRYEPRRTGRSKMRHLHEFVKFAVSLLRFRFGG